MTFIRCVRDLEDDSCLREEVKGCGALEAGQTYRELKKSHIDGPRSHGLKLRIVTAASAAKMAATQETSMV